MSPCRRSAACIGGDFRRKATLAEYGFRLPSCMDNRPLRFEVVGRDAPALALPCRPRRAIGRWGEAAGGVFGRAGYSLFLLHLVLCFRVLRVRAIRRDRAEFDPPVEVRPAKAQVDEVLGEIRETAAKRLPHFCAHV